ncbi:MAG: VOC family protein [Stackebrandtia sp.]
MHYGFHHIQLSCPAGSEEASRRFYVDVLGLTELTKPPALAARGGCWFCGPDEHGVEIHLGVEPDFRPALKAHPAVLWGNLESLCALSERLTAAGFGVTWDSELRDVPVRRHAGANAPTAPSGMHRFYTRDPHGNRIELMAPVEG